ncbi:hypothetical protein [Streptomyces mirabilis]|uniref:hypothetical protein n=1 Tax=Streptomyces mirabilis TaxID=68239 RepID=UPI0036B87604
MTGLAGLVVGAGVVGLVWGLSGSGASTPKTFTLRGAMTLTNPTPLDYDHKACGGSDGFGDIRQGAGVTVYDAEGKILGTGALGPGRYASEDSTAPCVFAVKVPGVPEGSKFYQVEISHRGKVTVSSAEAKAGKFAASLG